MKEEETFNAQHSTSNIEGSAVHGSAAWVLNVQS
jgi:hypothetical protein